jgi:hypothetical protein
LRRRTLPFYIENNQQEWRHLKALAIDQKIRESWLGHPHFKSSTTQPTLKEIIRAFSDFHFLGLKRPPDHREVRKNVQYENTCSPDNHIEQMYLRSKNKKEIRIRKRGKTGLTCISFQENID